MTKRLIKYLLRTTLCQWILSLIIFAYARLVQYTTSWQEIMDEEVKELFTQDTPIIFIMWHNRLMMTPCLRPKHKTYHAVISLHNDGQYVSKYMQLFGVIPIRGSSKRGGLGAIKGCINALKQKDCLVITPDGPRGPRFKIGGNLAAIAAKTGAPIVPYVWSTSRRNVLSTWDRFVLPKPFSKGVCIYDKPIYVTKESNQKDTSKTAQKALNKVTHKADELLGLERIKS